MEFIDGRAHAGGPHVFEEAKPGFSTGAGMEKSEETQTLARDEFSKEDAWESRWSVDKVAALNAMLRGSQCRHSSCADMFDHGRSSMQISAAEKTAWLTQILEDYYNAIDAIQVDASISDAYGAHIDQALLHIAVLYHKLALLHPFTDGNSRTRLMVLQTELVRQGGHPTVWWDNYWAIYRLPDSPRPDGEPSKLDNYNVSAMSGQLHEFVLDGWCGWETAYKTGASPYSPVVEVNGTLASTPYSQYNEETGACEQGPGREWWVLPFNKNKAAAAEDVIHP